MGRAGNAPGRCQPRSPLSGARARRVLDRPSVCSYAETPNTTRLYLIRNRI